ncbi:MAG: 2OG-Fe(II) oxygenase [Gammaproteobacteria bacterium]
MKIIKFISDHAPNFIGAWSMGNPGLCDKIIEYFDRNSPMHEAGATQSGTKSSRKNSTDLAIIPNALREPTHAVFRTYLRELHRCYLDYLRQWPFLFDDVHKVVDIGPFIIQKYDVGGHYAAVHTERASLATMHRSLAWMTYLNTVDVGGRTNFPHYGLDVKPERGKTLIWPADWTHAHKGNIVTTGSKYIITGWMHYPLAQSGAGIEAHELAAEG